MGVAFKELISSKDIRLDDLNNKIIIIDTYNILYQFLTTIRGPDGNLLTDTKGNPTSHLVGLFSRTASLMQRGIKLAFVFDGKPPELKLKVQEQRKSLKLEAEKKYQEAKKTEDLENMKKFASRTSRLTPLMVEESKELLTLMGLPIVQAPSEGEAQAAHMVRSNKGFAVGSQDFDSMIHGATKLVRNLSISGRRKRGRGVGFDTVNPELIDLSENLNTLGIDSDQLIALAMIIGTDYNPGGIKGIGPINAIKLVKKYNNNFDALFKEVKWDDFFNFAWTEVYYQIKNIPAIEDYSLEWNSIDYDNIFHKLVNKLGFSKDKVNQTLIKLRKQSSNQRQKSLEDF